MAKKGIDNSQIDQQAGIISFPLDQLMSDLFGRYAKYIIQERALPDVRDGLKPVQRRILYAMSDLKLWFDKPHKKSARVVGEVIGKYHPHGDTSIYEAMVRMSQTWKLGIPLIDMQGNNGSIDGDGAAAMRYTEARLAKISGLMLEDLEKQTVKFAPNFDDSEKEPTVLPAYFPNILTNGSTGIAAGYATNIPPHNLGEIIDATIKIVENPNTRLETILYLVQGPDFPTGGIVQGRDGIRDAFASGKGKVVINSKWHEEKGNIVIDEIPYEVVKQELVKKIGEVVDNNQGLGIHEVRDETDRDGLRIVVELSDKANLETVRKFLFKNTPLSVSYNYNNVVIVDKQPRLLGIVPILQAYANHYRDVLTRKSQFDLAKAVKRLEIVQGLIKVMGILDQVIRVIRQSTNRLTAIQNLVAESFGFSEAQATAIVDMRLYRLTSTDIEKLKVEAEMLGQQITHLQALLKNPDLMSKEIVVRLREVKKNYPTPRRTTISEFVENLDVELKDTLVEKRFHLWVSQDGYLKAIDSSLLTRNEMKDFGRKPNDIWITRTEVSNLNHLLLVSNVGTYYSIPLYKVEMSKWKDMGIHVNTVATMSGNEGIVSAFVVEKFAQATQQILLTTKLGLMKRTPIVDLETKIFTRSFKLMKLASDDEVVSATLVTSNTKNVVVITKNGYGVTYNLVDVPVQGANSQGVKAANLKNDEIIVGKSLEPTDDVFIITTNNRYKKINQVDIPTFVRPKRGVRLYPEPKRKAELVRFGFVVGDKDVLKILDDQDSIHELPVQPLRHHDTHDTPKELGIQGIVNVSLEKDYVVTNGDLPPVANSSDGGDKYISKAASQAKRQENRELNKTKASARIVVNQSAKLDAESKVQSSSSNLSDMLGDISSVLGNFKAPKKPVDKQTKNLKTPPPAPETEEIQLNFDDLFDD